MVVVVDKEGFKPCPAYMGDVTSFCRLLAQAGSENSTCPVRIGTGPCVATGAPGVLAPVDENEAEIWDPSFVPAIPTDATPTLK